MKFIVALAFLAILGSLASALIFMMRAGPSDQPRSKNMVKALGLRVGISKVRAMFSTTLCLGHGSTLNQDMRTAYFKQARKLATNCWHCLADTPCASSA
ncbi:MAG: DUF2909 domain-containing protein [Betaproteobacteria bacterium]|nr:DUF2909 domain-containing protein [Betaproteobacteria bacterium]